MLLNIWTNTLIAQWSITSYYVTFVEEVLVKDIKKEFASGLAASPT